MRIIINEKKGRREGERKRDREKQKFQMRHTSFKFYKAGRERVIVARSYNEISRSPSSSL